MKQETGGLKSGDNCHMDDSWSLFVPLALSPFCTPYCDKKSKDGLKEDITTNKEQNIKYVEGTNLIGQR